MPLPIIPKAIFPLVPNLPGVPALARSGAIILDALTLGKLGLADALDAALGTNGPQWGIFDATGQPIAVADSIVSVGYRNSNRISDYPQELGAFASYNKVENPYNIKVRMTRGGTEDDRAQFIKALDAAEASMQLFSVMMPEATYLSASIEGIEYMRESGGGAYLITADISLIEIRNTVTAAFSAPVPKSLNGAVPVSQGQAQSFPVTQSVLAATTLGPLITGLAK